MRVMDSFLIFLVSAAFFVGCGSSPQLEGVSLGDIRLEGELAEEVTADLETALTDEGAMLHQSDEADLVGTLTWEWAGEGGSRYPTLVKVFMQSEPEEGGLTVSTRYEVPRGAQPRDVAHYQRELVDRIVRRIAAQHRGAP